MSEQQSRTETTDIWVDRKGMTPFKITVPVGDAHDLVLNALNARLRPLLQQPARPLKEWEVYTLIQDWPLGNIEAAVNCDRMLAAKLNDGWEILDIRTEIGSECNQRVVTMKRRTPCPKCGELRGADAFCGNRDCSDYLGW